jgi:uncharacterized membrane protein YkoI
MNNKLTIPLAAFALIATGALGTYAYQSHAQTNAATTDDSTQSSQGTQISSTQPKQFDPSKGGHIGQNGTKEELLTGDTAEKAKAAALAANPGGTIQRVENDAEGAAYEAHMTKADGTQITVKMDSNFNVTGTETGGPGGHGGRGDNDGDAQ